MKVTTVKEAWNMVNRIFPYDYVLDEQRSERAGYKIYMSTTYPDGYAWICDLGDVRIRVYGMIFTTKHSAEYFRERDEDETDERGRLLAKSIKDMALVNGQLIVNLE